MAHALQKNPKISPVVLERTNKFKRFGGPIQLASNALQILKSMDPGLYSQIDAKFTETGDKENGIKDGIRDEWYAKFDLATPAKDRNMPYTGVIERPDLQEIFLDALDEGTVRNGNGISSYEVNKDGFGVRAEMEDGTSIEGDVLIGADGIWSVVRSAMRGEPAKGEGSGCSYSGYTVFAGELAYDSFDNGKVGYKVYIGPGQYFVITDIGKGNYQWYAFLARDPDSSETEEKPDGSVPFLANIFEGWSKDIHHILQATKEDEIQQRDLYDRPPNVIKPWVQGPVGLIGDAVHAMMPNLGQGGCQAIEDAYVLEQELGDLTSRHGINDSLRRYRGRRLVRSAAVQGLSRFASDIIIRGFDTPAKITLSPFKVENFNYAGIVTRILQPILPIFFIVQFNFLYDGWENDKAFDLKNGLAFILVGFPILLVLSGTLGEIGLLGGLGADALLGTEGLVGGESVVGGEGFDAIVNTFQEVFANFGSFF